jgi:hypothetical protein
MGVTCIETGMTLGAMEIGVGNNPSDLVEIVNNGPALFMERYQSIGGEEAKHLTYKTTSLSGHCKISSPTLNLTLDIGGLAYSGDVTTSKYMLGISSLESSTLTRVKNDPTFVTMDGSFD